MSFPKGGVYMPKEIKATILQFCRTGTLYEPLGIAVKKSQKNRRVYRKISESESDITVQYKGSDHEK